MNNTTEEQIKVGKLVDLEKKIAMFELPDISEEEARVYAKVHIALSIKDAKEQYKPSWLDGCLDRWIQRKEDYCKVIDKASR